MAADGGGRREEIGEEVVGRVWPGGSYRMYFLAFLSVSRLFARGCARDAAGARGPRERTLGSGEERNFPIWKARGPFPFLSVSGSDRGWALRSAKAVPGHCVDAS